VLASVSGWPQIGIRESAFVSTPRTLAESVTITESLLKETVSGVKEFCSINNESSFCGKTTEAKIMRVKSVFNINYASKKSSFNENKIENYIRVKKLNRNLHKCSKTQFSF